MRADLLLEHFDTLVRTPGDVAVLETTILDLVVRGQLVPQDPNDEPASILLERIQAERAQLIREKIINSGNYHSPIGIEEIPYELPEGWLWVRLPDIYYDWGQTEPDKKFTYIDVSSVNSGLGILIEDLQVIEPEDAPSRARKIIKRDTVIYGTVRPYLLNIAIVERDYVPPPIASTAFEVMHPFTGVLNRYLFYYLRSKSFIAFVESQMVGMAYPAISKTRLQQGLFPLPPLAEQKRIVNRVDELLAQTRELSSRLEEADVAFIPAARAAFHALAEPPCPVSASPSVPKPSSDAWQRIADAFDSFTGDPRTLDLLKQMILQLAVQGQLVPQDPNDESASTLLERIQAEKVAAMEEAQIHGAKRLIGIKSRGESVPLPQKWEWCRLADVTLNIHYGYTASADYSLKNFRMLRITDIQDNKVDWESVPGCEIEDEIAQKYLLRDGDILIARTGGTIGKTYLVKDLSVKAVFASYLIRVIPALNIDSQYLKFFLESPSYWDQLARHSKGTGQPNVNATSLSGLVLPLPPFAEQQRIVAKVEQLLGLCDVLAAEAAAAETVRTRLLAAVVNGG